MSQTDCTLVTCCIVLEEYCIKKAGASKPGGNDASCVMDILGGEEKILWPVLYCKFCNVCFIGISFTCMGHESQFVFCIVVVTWSLQFDNVIELRIKSNLFFHCKPFKHTFLGRLPNFGSRPNTIWYTFRPYVRPSTKSFFDFDKIWYTGSSRWEIKN